MSSRKEERISALKDAMSMVILSASVGKASTAIFAIIPQVIEYLTTICNGGKVFYSVKINFVV